MDEIRELGHTILGILAMPGEVVVGGLLAHFPALQDLPVSGYFDAVFALYVLVSVLAWLIAAIMLRWVLGRLRIAGRWLATLLDSAVFRFSLAIRNLRRALVGLGKRFWPARPARGIEIGNVDIDDVDIAVLKTAASQPPGITVSAPELAEQFGYRPGEIEQSLAKLCRCKLLEIAIGSTDGFDNCRVTPTGAIYARGLHGRRQITAG